MIHDQASFEIEDNGIPDFQGVFVPYGIYLSRELSFIERFLLIDIASLIRNARGCYASNRHFADKFDMSTTRISEVVSSLTEKGYISCELIRKGRQIVQRIISLTQKAENLWSPTYSQTCKKVVGNASEPSSENAKEKRTNTKITKEDYTPSAQKGTAWKTEEISSLPETWESEANKVGLSKEDSHDQFQRFSDFWGATAGAKGRKVDWLATWRNWCRNFIDRNPGKKVVDVKPDGPDWDGLMQAWVKTGRWPTHRLGSNPTERDCEAPADVMLKYGFVKGDRNPFHGNPDILKQANGLLI